MYIFEWWKDGQKQGSYHCGDPEQEEHWITKDSMESGLRLGFSMLKDKPADVGATIWFEDLT